MSDSDAAPAAVARLGQWLGARRWTLAVAESCTGGLVSHWITNLSGSSAFFLGGVVAYANAVKEQVLGVPGELLARDGAVSASVALAMAQGVRRLLGTEVGLATTGIAGPTGGTPQKPVGTVYVAAVTPLGKAVRHHVWDADRLGNKRRSAEAVLALLEELLEG